MSNSIKLLSVNDCKEVVIKADVYQKLLDRVKDLEEREEALARTTKALVEGKAVKTYMSQGRRDYYDMFDQIIITECQAIHEMYEATEKENKTNKALFIKYTEKLNDLSSSKQAYERKSKEFTHKLGKMSRRDALKYWKACEVSYKEYKESHKSYSSLPFHSTAW